MMRTPMIMDPDSVAEMRRFLGEVQDPVVRDFIQYLTLDAEKLDHDTWPKKSRVVVEHVRDQAAAAKCANDLRPTVVSWWVLSWLFKLIINQGDKAHFPGFIEYACTTWWDSMAEAQLRLGCGAKEAHRGIAAYTLTLLAIAQGDRGSALRWAALGRLSDALSERWTGSGNDVALTFGLGAPAETLLLLDSLATSIDAKDPLIERTPEWLLSHALHHAHGMALIAPSPRYAHHASVPFVRAAVAHAFDDANASNAEKGSRLERLIAFLITTIPGMRARLRMISAGRSAEIDIVATFVGESAYPLPERTDAWLIECKNWQRRASSSVVGHFFAKMKRTNTRFGILVAKSGLTGRDDDTAAERFQRDLAMKDDSVCLVVTENDLRGFGATETFRGFVDARYERWRFGVDPAEIRKGSPEPRKKRRTKRT